MVFFHDHETEIPDHAKILDENIPWSSIKNHDTTTINSQFESLTQY
jgi:hypothetical protein